MLQQYFQFQNFTIMEAYHDVEIYAGAELATTASRLELGASNDWLRSLFAGRSLCDGCKEPLVIIFPEDDKNTVRAAFDSLAHFNSGLSIVLGRNFYLIIDLGLLLHICYILDPEKVNSLLSRLREKPWSENMTTSSVNTDQSEISTSGNI